MSTSSLELISAEYQAALVRLHRIENSLPLAGTAGLILSAGAAAYATGHRAGLNPGYAWAAPLPFLATAVMLWVLISQRYAAVCRLAELRQQLGLIPSESANPYTHFLIRLVWLPIAGAALLYGVTLFICWRALHTGSPLSATLFGLTYLSFTGATALLGWAVRRQARQQEPLNFSQVRQVLLPYPAEWITGFGLITAGWLAGWLTIGLNAVQLPLLETIFQRNSNPEQGLPLAAVAALGLLVFAIIEGLLAPAGKLWRDLRAARAAGADPAAIDFGYAQVLLRLGLALPLAYWTGGSAVLILALLIWLQQTASALATPVTQAPLAARAAAGRARFDLLWGSLLYPLRFYAGVLVWTGPAWSFTILLLLFCMVGFLAVGFSAAWRARQARLQSPTGASLEGDAETASLTYDLHSAPRWQHAAFLAAGLTLLGLHVVQVLTENPDFYNELLANGYGFNDQGTLVYHQVSLVNSLLLVFDLLILGLLACAGVVRLLARSKVSWILFIEQIRPLGIPVLAIIAVGLITGAFFTGMLSLILAGLLLGILGAALWAER